VEGDVNHEDPLEGSRPIISKDVDMSDHDNSESGVKRTLHLNSPMYGVVTGNDDNTLAIVTADYTIPLADVPVVEEENDHLKCSKKDGDISPSLGLVGSREGPFGRNENLTTELQGAGNALTVHALQDV
jgi:hypothetical protein